MGNYASLHLVGHLGRDAELKKFDNGGSIIKFSVATSEVWKNKNGEKQERTDWHDVEMNGEQGRNLVQYLTKGKMVLVEGSLRYDEWEDGGKKRRAAKVRARKVVLLSPSGKPGPSAETGPAPTPEPGPFQASDDDVPF